MANGGTVGWSRGQAAKGRCGVWMLRFGPSRWSHSESDGPWAGCVVSRALVLRVEDCATTRRLCIALVAWRRRHGLGWLRGQATKGRGDGWDAAEALRRGVALRCVLASARGGVRAGERLRARVGLRAV
jgi:hypothetical protein